VLGSDGSVYLNWPGSQYPYNALASYKVSVTDPYFMGCSWNATGQTVSFTMNLRTGQLIFDDTQPGVTGSVHADNGIVSIGCDGSGSGTTSSIACGMYQSGYIPTALARRWCQNPWAFWYPDV
jgi:hypothetical protein